MSLKPEENIPSSAYIFNSLYTLNLDIFVLVVGDLDSERPTVKRIIVVMNLFFHFLYFLHRTIFSHFLHMSLQNLQVSLEKDWPNLLVQKFCHNRVRFFYGLVYFLFRIKKI